jgi:type IV pilus assembly protein PilX
MHHRIRQTTPGAKRDQRGVVLFVALIFLVILSLIGVTVARMQTTEERMARNEDSRQVAEATAEAALRNGENTLQNSPGISAFAANTGGLYYLSPSAGSAVPSLWWTNPVNYAVYGTAPLATTAPALTSLPTAAQTPKVVIEYMGAVAMPGDDMSNPPVTYRITVVAAGPDGTPGSMLQSIYR